jgi:hypothetical protein
MVDHDSSRATPRLELGELLSRPVRLTAAFAFATLAGGIPLWPMPYNQCLPVFLLWCGTGTVAGFLIARRTPLPPFRTAFMVTGGFLASYVVRLAVDFSGDPTSHNLLPFELVGVVFAGMVLGWIGGSVGYQRARDAPE